MRAAGCVLIALGLSGAGLWIHSYWRVDRLLIGFRSSFIVVESEAGRLAVARSIQALPGSRLRQGISATSSLIRPRMKLANPNSNVISFAPDTSERWEDHHFGFNAAWMSVVDDKIDRNGQYVSMTGTEWRICVPHWFLMAGISIVTLPFVLRLRTRSSRKAEGCCIKCGYDLRSSSDRCPECGTTIQRSDATTPI